MQHINRHRATVTPVILPPAFAEGAEPGAAAQARCAQSVFVDVTPCDDPETQHYHALWRAVIAQHIADAKNTSQKPAKQLRKKEAIDWLFHSESDFTMACDLAGWEPEYVRSLCLTAHSHAFCRRGFFSINSKQRNHA